MHKLKRSTFLIFLLLWPSVISAAATNVEPFGLTSKGESVSQITLTNDRDMRVALISYGATLTTVEFADRSGKVHNVVLSLPDMASYERTQRRWGGIIGRYAGRIAGAQFQLDGVTHRLEPGRNGVTLHGGNNGYDKRVWAFRTHADARSVAAIFTLLSPVGDQGFPGALRLEVTYRLMRKANELRLEYRATTSAPTVVNFTNHAFFNLAGAGTGTIANHNLTIVADHYAPTDAIKIPTGELLPVVGTPLDFRQPQRVGQAMDNNHPLLAASKGFDHSYSFRRPASVRPQPVAILHDPVSGRRMTIATTEPGLQFNTGNGFDGTEVGSEGVAYPIYSGLALETQHLPNSPNQPIFPSTRLNPEKPFYSMTTYRFSIR
ncbi:aldose epimerase family protein [Aquidulcibacter sp.]|jgi:aldose 1-epimerase|uniref:aldose epimerase family protein n=1 Tax=Aquidulcibacter sp. TaxID=2052990 RepID=UPI0028AD20ED|nr:aldose epimerase family protein [Aquidulcibacter sp.]